MVHLGKIAFVFPLVEPANYKTICGNSITVVQFSGKPVDLATLSGSALTQAEITPLIIIDSFNLSFISHGKSQAQLLTAGGSKHDGNLVKNLNDHTTNTSMFLTNC